MKSKKILSKVTCYLRRCGIEFKRSGDSRSKFRHISEGGKFCVFLFGFLMHQVPSERGLLLKEKKLLPLVRSDWIPSDKRAKSFVIELLPHQVARDHFL